MTMTRPSSEMGWFRSRQAVDKTCWLGRQEGWHHGDQGVQAMPIIHMAPVAGVQEHGQPAQGQVELLAPQVDHQRAVRPEVCAAPRSGPGTAVGVGHGGIKDSFASGHGQKQTSTSMADRSHLGCRPSTP